MGSGNAKEQPRQIAHQKEFLGACWDSPYGQLEVTHYIPSRWMGVSKQVMELHTGNACFLIRYPRNKEATHVLQDLVGEMVTVNNTSMPGSPTCARNALQQHSPSYLHDESRVPRSVSALSANSLIRPPSFCRHKAPHHHGRGNSQDNPSHKILHSGQVPVSSDGAHPQSTHAEMNDSSSQASAPHVRYKQRKAQKGRTTNVPQPRSVMTKVVYAFKQLTRWQDHGDPVLRGAGQNARLLMRIMYDQHPYLQASDLCVQVGVFFRVAPSCRRYDRIALLWSPEVAAASIGTSDCRVAIGHNAVNNVVTTGSLSDRDPFSLGVADKNKTSSLSIMPFVGGGVNSQNHQQRCPRRKLEERSTQSHNTVAFEGTITSTCLRDSLDDTDDGLLNNLYPLKAMATVPPVIVGSISAFELLSMPPTADVCLGNWLYISLQDEQQRLLRALADYKSLQWRQARKTTTQSAPSALAKPAIPLLREESVPNRGERTNDFTVKRPPPALSVGFRASLGTVDKNSNTSARNGLQGGEGMWLPYAYAIIALPMYECAINPNACFLAMHRAKPVSFNIRDDASRRAFGVGCITKIRYGGAMIIECRDQIFYGGLDTDWVQQLIECAQDALKKWGDGASGVLSGDTRGASESANGDDCESNREENTEGPRGGALCDGAVISSALGCKRRAERLAVLKMRILSKLHRSGFYVVSASTRHRGGGDVPQGAQTLPLSGVGAAGPSKVNFTSATTTTNLQVDAAQRRQWHSAPYGDSDGLAACSKVLSTPRSTSDEDSLETRPGNAMRRMQLPFFRKKKTRMICGTFRQLGGMRFLNANDLMEGCRMSEVVKGVERWIQSLLITPIRARPLSIYLQRYEGLTNVLRQLPSSVFKGVACCALPECRLGRSTGVHFQNNNSFMFNSFAGQRILDAAMATPGGVMDSTPLTPATNKELSSQARPYTDYFLNRPRNGGTSAFSYSHYTGPLDPVVAPVLSSEFEEIATRCETVNGAGGRYAEAAYYGSAANRSGAAATMPGAQPKHVEGGCTSFFMGVKTGTSSPVSNSNVAAALFNSKAMPFISSVAMITTESTDKRGNSGDDANRYVLSADPNGPPLPSRVQGPTELTRDHKDPSMASLLLGLSPEKRKRQPGKCCGPLAVHAGSGTLDNLSHSLSGQPRGSGGEGATPIGHNNFIEGSGVDNMEAWLLAEKRLRDLYADFDELQFLVCDAVAEQQERVKEYVTIGSLFLPHTRSNQLEPSTLFLKALHYIPEDVPMQEIHTDWLPMLLALVTTPPSALYSPEGLVGGGAEMLTCISTVITEDVCDSNKRLEFYNRAGATKYIVERAPELALQRCHANGDGYLAASHSKHREFLREVTIAPLTYRLAPSMAYAFERSGVDSGLSFCFTGGSLGVLAGVFHYYSSFVMASFGQEMETVLQRRAQCMEQGTLSCGEDWNASSALEMMEHRGHIFLRRVSLWGAVQGKKGLRSLRKVRAMHEKYYNTVFDVNIEGSDKGAMETQGRHGSSHPALNNTTCTSENETDSTHSNKARVLSERPLQHMVNTVDQHATRLGIPFRSVECFALFDSIAHYLRTLDDVQREYDSLQGNQLCSVAFDGKNPSYTSPSETQFGRRRSVLSSFFGRWSSITSRKPAMNGGKGKDIEASSNFPISNPPRRSQCSAKNVCRDSISSKSTAIDAIAGKTLVCQGKGGTHTHTTLPSDSMPPPHHQLELPNVFEICILTNYYEKQFIQRENEPLELASAGAASRTAKTEDFACNVSHLSSTQAMLSYREKDAHDGTKRRRKVDSCSCCGGGSRRTAPWHKQNDERSLSASGQLNDGRNPRGKRKLDYKIYRILREMDVRKNKLNRPLYKTVASSAFRMSCAMRGTEGLYCGGEEDRKTQPALLGMWPKKSYKFFAFMAKCLERWHARHAGVKDELAPYRRLIRVSLVSAGEP